MHATHVGTLTIPVGTQVSNILSNEGLYKARQIALDGGGAAFDGTVTVQASGKRDAAAADMRALSRNGDTAITIDATEFTVIDVSCVQSIRLSSSTAEDPARTVEVYALV